MHCMQTDFTGWIVLCSPMYAYWMGTKSRLQLCYCYLNPPVYLLFSLTDDFLLCSCNFVVINHIWWERNAACYNQLLISLCLIPPGLLVTTEYTSQWMRCLSDTCAHVWYWRSQSQWESYPIPRPIQGHKKTPKCSWSKFKCVLLLFIMYPLGMRTTVYNVVISPTYVHMNELVVYNVSWLLISDDTQCTQVKHNALKFLIP